MCNPLDVPDGYIELDGNLGVRNDFGAYERAELPHYCGEATPGLVAYLNAVYKLGWVQAIREAERKRKKGEP